MLNGGFSIKKVKLSFLADALEETFDRWQQFYNTRTGEVESIPDGDNGYVDRGVFAELAEKIDASDDYVRLPNQWDIHEYKIMESFAEEKNSGELFRVLRGRKPYRHFKDRIIELGIDKEYYDFRHRAYYEISRRWCDDHGIPYEEDQS